MFGCGATSLFARGLCRPHWTEVKNYGFIWPRYPNGKYRASCIWCREPFGGFYHPMSGRALFCGAKECKNRYYHWKEWVAPKLWARLCPYCKNPFQARTDANHCGSESCRWQHAKSTTDALKKAADRTARWRKQNPTAHKEWVKANPKRWRGYERVRQTKRKVTQIPGQMTEGAISARLSMFAGCWMCGGDADTIDHVKPLSRGGAHILANIRPACRPCNSSKNAAWPLPELVAP